MSTELNGVAETPHPVSLSKAVPVVIVKQLAAEVGLTSVHRSTLERSGFTVVGSQPTTILADQADMLREQLLARKANDDEIPWDELVAMLKQHIDFTYQSQGTGGDTGNLSKTDILEQFPVGASRFTLAFGKYHSFLKRSAFNELVGRLLGVLEGRKKRRAQAAMSTAIVDNDAFMVTTAHNKAIDAIAASAEAHEVEEAHEPTPRGTAISVLEQILVRVVHQEVETLFEAMRMQLSDQLRMQLAATLDVVRALSKFQAQHVPSSEQQQQVPSSEQQAPPIAQPDITPLSILIKMADSPRLSSREIKALQTLISSDGSITAVSRVLHSNQLITTNVVRRAIQKLGFNDPADLLKAANAGHSSQSVTVNQYDATTCGVC